MFTLQFTFIVLTMVGRQVKKMKILLIFSGLGHNRGGSTCFTMST